MATKETRTAEAFACWGVGSLRCLARNPLDQPWQRLRDRGKHPRRIRRLKAAIDPAAERLRQPGVRAQPLAQYLLIAPPRALRRAAEPHARARLVDRIEEDLQLQPTPVQPHLAAPRAPVLPRPRAA